MVKNFKGETKPRPKLPELSPVLVSDFMATSLTTFRPEQSIYEVVHTLITMKISGGPVVNKDNELVGIISEGDCLKEVVKGKYHDMPVLSGCVEEHMAKSVVSIPPTMCIFDVAKMFLEKRLRRFPVVYEGKLIGQISQKDVMRAMAYMQPVSQYQ